MEKLDLLRAITRDEDTPNEVMEFYLDNAKDIICDLRDAEEVEPKYDNVQVRIAVELYVKSGIEGQTSHAENGISRVFASADVSPSLLNLITPRVRTLR